MLKRKDVFVAICILAIAAVVYGIITFVNSQGTPAGYVRIYVNGELYATARLGQEQPITITQENGDTNVIAFTKNGVYMASSSCANQLCVQQGTVSTENYKLRVMGNKIICLPHGIVVELVLLDDGENGADLPDI